MKTITQMFKLTIGLGNSGAEYRNTYHNVGHLFIDFAREARPEWAAEKTEGFMNESGMSVRAIMKRRNAKPEETLIAHDDSDLFIGEFKLSRGRGSAGHKGVRHIMDTLKTKDFWRLRIGIRPRGEEQSGAGLPAEARRAKAGEFVLKQISPADSAALIEVFQHAANAIAAL